MPLLHMDTDLVRGVGNRLQQAAVFLQQQNQQLNYSAQALANSWQGNSATIFMGEIQSLLQRLSQIVHSGEILNQRLQSEIEEWEALGFGYGSGIGHWSPRLPIDHLPPVPTMALGEEGIRPGPIPSPMPTPALGEEGIRPGAPPSPMPTLTLGEEGVRPGPFPPPSEPPGYSTMALGEEGQWPGDHPGVQTLRYPEEGMPPGFGPPKDMPTSTLSEHGEPPNMSFAIMPEEGQGLQTLAYPEDGMAPPWEDGKMSFAVYPEEGTRIDPIEFITKLAAEEGQATTFALGEEGQESPIDLGHRDVTTLRFGEEGQTLPEIDNSYSTMAVGEEGQMNHFDLGTLTAGEDGEGNP